MKTKLKFLTKMSLERKTKSKWFKIANILLCLLIICAFNIDSIITLFGGDFNNKTNIYVIDNSDYIYDLFNEQMGFSNTILYEDQELNYTITRYDKSLDEAKEELENDDKHKIILEFTESEDNIIDVTMLSKEYVDMTELSVLTTALNNTKASIAMVKYDISTEEINDIYSGVNVNRIFLDEDMNNTDENMEVIVSAVFPFIILPFFMLSIFLVQMIGAEVNDEKTTRGMEIIISNVSPKTHFTAKVLAGNIFVLLQGILLILYAGLGFFIRGRVSGGDITSGLGGQISSLVTGVLSTSLMDKLVYIIPLVLILMVITFIGYSLLAGVLASMTTNIEDFQQLQTPIMIISLVGYYLSMMAGMFKGSLFIRLLSYVPFISAILSPSLLVLGQIGIIDMIISMVIMVVVIYLLIKYGLKIYKVGILNYSSKDLWKKMFKAMKEKN